MFGTVFWHILTVFWLILYVGVWIIEHRGDTAIVAATIACLAMASKEDRK